MLRPRFLVKFGEGFRAKAAPRDFRPKPDGKRRFVATLGADEKESSEKGGEGKRRERERERRK